MLPDMKAIAIKCRGALSLPLEALVDFQGDLKTLTDESYQKLRKEILELGYSEPISIWQSKKGKTISNYILNGHQRVKTIRRMVEEGFRCSELPVSVVEASSLKEAKKKLLAFTSQYGAMTMDGLKNFMTDAGMTLQDLDNFEFPEISLPEFSLLFAPPAPEESGPEPEKKTVSFDAYKNAAVKQVVLYYPAEVYQKLVPKLDQLAKRWKLEDYSQVVLRCVNETV